MIGFGIVNAGLDVALFQKSLAIIAAHAANDIHVVHGVRPIAFRWGVDDPAEPLIVSSRNLSPIFIESIQVLEHDAANRRVDFIKSNIIARKFMVVFSLSPMV